MSNKVERKAQAINKLSISGNDGIDYLKRELGKITPKEFTKLSDKLDIEKLEFIIKNAISIGTHNQHPLVVLRDSNISKSIDAKGIIECLTTQYVDKKGHPIENKEEGVMLLEHMHTKKLKINVSDKKVKPLELVIKVNESVEKIAESNISTTDILSFYNSEDSKLNETIQNIIVDRAKSGRDVEVVMCQLIDAVNSKPKPSKEKLSFLQNTYKMCQNTVMKDSNSLKPEEQKMVKHAQTVFEAILKYCVDHPRITREVFKHQDTTKAMKFLGMPESFDVAKIFFSLDFEKACKHIDQMKEITGGGKDRVFKSFTSIPGKNKSAVKQSINLEDVDFQEERTGAKGSAKSQNSLEHISFRRTTTQSILNSIKKMITSMIYSGIEKQRNSTVLKFLNGVKKRLEDDILPNIRKDMASYSDMWYELESFEYKEYDLVDLVTYTQKHTLIRDNIMSILLGWINCSVIKNENNMEVSDVTNVREEVLAYRVNKPTEAIFYMQGKEDGKNVQFIKTAKNPLQVKDRTLEGGKKRIKHADAIDKEREKKKEIGDDQDKGKHR